MKLIAPSGGVVTVADQRAAELQRKGYRLPEAAVKAAPGAGAPARKRPTRKSSVETKDEESK